MMAWGLGLTVLIVFLAAWWYAHRPLSPSELEPMSDRWLRDPHHHKHVVP